MRIFKQNKLWRDKAVDMIEQNHGSKIHWRCLDDIEFDQQFRVKLLEEAHEVAAAKDRKELIGELADIYEVIDYLAQVNQISHDEIRAMQIKKREGPGGFYGDDSLILLSILQEVLVRSIALLILINIQR